MNLWRKFQAWREAWAQARREMRALAKLMCLMAAMDAPEDVAADLRRMAREDLSN